MGDPGEEEDDGDSGPCFDEGGGDGLSVTRISGLSALSGSDSAGEEAIINSFSEVGGLAGWTTSIGRLSMLIMAKLFGIIE